MSGELSFTGRLLEAGYVGIEQEVGIVVEIGTRQITVTGLSKLEVRAFAGELDKPVSIQIGKGGPRGGVP